jgi:probable HAF family extracellular repeat protein
MTPSFGFTRSAVLAVLVTASVAARPASTPYRIVDLGGLSGPGGGAIAQAINDRGQIVGIGWVPGEEDTVHAVLWDRGGIIDLGTLTGGGESFAVAINNKGQIVGHSGANAVLWDHRTMVDLGGLDRGCTDDYCFSSASSINDRGQIVGYGSELGPGQSHHAMLWDHGTITDLGTLTDGGTSMAVAINERGQIAGISNAADGMPHAVMWDHGTITDLGLLPRSHAASVSASTTKARS